MRAVSASSCSRLPGVGSAVRRTWYAMSKRASSTQTGRPCSNGTGMIRFRNRGMRCRRDPTSRRVSASRNRPESSKNGGPSKMLTAPTCMGVSSRSRCRNEASSALSRS